MLTIGIDARAATEVPAGRGRVVRELLAALARRGDDGVRYELYARARWDQPLDERFTWRLVPSADPLWHVRTALAASRSCDVFLSSNSYLTAWFLRVPSVVVVYDLVPFVEGARAQSRAARIERVTMGPAMRRAAALWCISEATRADLVARYPAVAERARTIPLAADGRFASPVPEATVHAARERHGLTRPYVLAAGTLEPRKNLPRLVQAWAALPEALRAGHQLALAGPVGWEEDETLQAARARGEEVRLLGYVEEDDLVALYSGCTAFAYPSLYEGFGLPVLEAMLAGAPTITSTTSSLPEVAGDAALLVDPLDTAAITAALQRVLLDEALRDDLRRRGRRRAATFSWDRCARDVRALLDQVAAIARR